MRHALVLLPLLLSLAGCDKIAELLGVAKENSNPSAVSYSEQTPISTEHSLYNFEINTSSPDQALKTWWRYLDAKNVIYASRCEANMKVHANEFEISSVATGGIEQSLKSRGQRCSITIYNREIVEVKQETETRAIIFSKVTNATPSTASHTSEDEKRRDEGEQFKYLIEKTPSGWKVSQVYKYGDTNKMIGKDEWSKEYTPSVANYPIYVFEEQ